MNDRLPDRLAEDVRTCAYDFYRDHRWARQFLSQARGMTYEKSKEEEERTDDEDRNNIFMVMSRFDSFREKYAVHEFDDKQLLYAVYMMLSFNNKERTRAVQDSEDIIRESQRMFPAPP